MILSSADEDVRAKEGREKGDAGIYVTGSETKPQNFGPRKGATKTNIRYITPPES